MGMGFPMEFPMGLGIPWKSHGNGTKIEPIVGMGMGMGKDLDGNDPHSPRAVSFTFRTSKRKRSPFVTSEIAGRRQRA